METAHHENEDNHIYNYVKDIVVVFDGNNTCITDILRAVVSQSEDYLSHVVALGFIDGTQFRELVKILDRDKTLPQ